MKNVVLYLIRTYQKSDFLKKPFLKTIVGTEGYCRFTPTCSDYFYQAVNKYGTIKGSFLGIKRILRCHPWSKGGYDPLS